MNKKERKAFLKEQPSRSMTDAEWKQHALKDRDVVQEGLDWLEETESDFDGMDEANGKCTLDESEKKSLEKLTKKYGWT